MPTPPTRLNGSFHYIFLTLNAHIDIIKVQAGTEQSSEKWGAQWVSEWVFPMPLRPDMEKGADAQTLSIEIFENCGNFWIMDDY